MKKKLFIFSLAVICLSLCIGGTVAFFSTTDTSKNVITTGTIAVELIETDAEGKPFVNPVGVLPGTEVSKIVTVKNVGGNACWIRISLDEMIALEEGRDGTPDLTLISLDINTSDWTEKDGLYYYNSVLEPGESTKPLFTKVCFKSDMNNMYQNSTANININAQAVQTANNGKTALEAAGWPEIGADSASEGQPDR